MSLRLSISETFSVVTRSLPGSYINRRVIFFLRVAIVYKLFMQVVHVATYITFANDISCQCKFQLNIDFLKEYLQDYKSSIILPISIWIHSSSLIFLLLKFSCLSGSQFLKHFR